MYRHIHTQMPVKPVSVVGIDMPVDMRKDMCIDMYMDMYMDM